MNRIRIKNNQCQVLISPRYEGPFGFQNLINYWSDANLNNYSIVNFNNLQDAQAEAFKYPDLDWHLIISHHAEIYKFLKKAIKDVIATNNFNVNFISSIATPEKLKNMVFDRVQKEKPDFEGNYGISDMIQFNITNPWTDNLKFIANILSKQPNLFIQASYEKTSGIFLIGKTTIGTSYLISLTPSHLSNVFNWALKNPNNNAFQDVYKKAILQQTDIDKSPILL